MAKKKKIDDEVKPYGLDPLFERLIAEMATCRPSFWGRVGHEIDAERIVEASASLVLRACKAIAAEGRPPNAPEIVLQRITSWHEQGKVEVADLNKARKLCAVAREDSLKFEEESVIAELAPLLTRSLQKTALEHALQQFGKRGKLDQAEKLLARAKRIGASDISVGSILTSKAVPAIVADSNIVRFGTGIEDLDHEIGGGIKRATMTIVTGSTGSGKSMMLDHFVSHAIINKHASAIATLELCEADHYARIVGNLTDLPYSDLLNYPDVTLEAEHRMQILEEEGVLSFCSCKYFDPGTTTVSDIEAWLIAEEEVHGVKITVLGVDYAQLLAAEPGHSKARYEELADIAKALRALAVRRNLWLMSPNQASGEGMDPKKTKILQNHHSADSKGIPKNADLHITINPRDDSQSILWHVAKNRYGPQDRDAGPLPVEFEKGRCAPVNRRGFPF